MFKILFYLVMAIVFLYNGFTHAVLWYNLWLSRDNKKRSFSYYLLLLKSFIAECLFTLLNILLYLIHFLSPARSASAKEISSLSDDTPILFVHGYLHHQLAWLWFIYQFKKKIKRPVMLFALNLSPPFSSMSKMAKLISNKISEIHKITGSSKIVLIGHSMGGILSCYYTEYLAKPGEVDKVITIGSPLRGTCIAAYGIGKNAKEMLPSSKFLRHLNKRIKRSKVAYFSVASRIDNVIIPWQSALLINGQSNNNNFIINDYGHLGLLMSKPAIRQVCKWVL